MQAFCLAGMGFGDEAKGAATDSLARQFPGEDVLIVRYNGGCQSAHNVVTPEGRHHTFSQFGAGMLASDKARTHLSRFMLVEPFSMINESRALNALTPFVWGRTTVDARAPIITPFCKYLNQLRERSRGKNRHGSCGRGIGVTRELQIRFNDDERVLRAGDLRDEKLTFEKLMIQLKAIFDEMQDLEQQVGEDPSSEREHRRAILEWVTRYGVWPAKIVDEMPKFTIAIFEGAQGVMLDETYGTAPHNTWTNTTFENADTLLDEAGVDKYSRYNIGCFRTYYTRHGHGPFPTEDPALDLPEEHNNDSGFQGVFRRGHFDFTLANSAYQVVGGLDGIALSHLDYLPRMGWDENDFIASIKANLGTPICMTGRGPTAAERVWNKKFEVSNGRPASSSEGTQAGGGDPVLTPNIPADQREVERLP